MFITLNKPRFIICPRCKSTNTFLPVYKDARPVYKDARFCLSCNKMYNRADEVRLKEQKMDQAKWTV